VRTVILLVPAMIGHNTGFFPSSHWIGANITMDHAA